MSNNAKQVTLHILEVENTEGIHPPPASGTVIKVFTAEKHVVMKGPFGSKDEALGKAAEEFKAGKTYESQRILESTPNDEDFTLILKLE